MKKGEDSWESGAEPLWGAHAASRAGDGALAITDFSQDHDHYTTFIGWADVSSGITPLRPVGLSLRNIPTIDLLTYF